MKAYLSALRLKTLPAAIVPVALAVALVHRSGGELDVGLFLCVLGSAIAIQIATNFFNDAIDSDTGADGEDRLGPVRATASGLLSRCQVMAAGYGALFLAVLFSIPLVMKGGLVIVAIGLPSVYLAYGYTGGVLRLAYRGLGELFVMLFFGWIAVLGTVWIFDGSLNWRAWALGTACGGFSSVLIAVNNLRDFQGDKRVGKMTLAARFGKGVGRLVVTLAVLLGFGGLFGTELNYHSNNSLLVYGMPLFISLVILHIVWRWEPSKKFNIALGLGGLQLVLVAMIFIWRSL